MKQWKLLLGVALVFVVGILVGSAGTRFFFHHHHGFFPAVSGQRTAFIVKRLARELGLTDAQKVTVRKIVEDTGEKLRDHFLQRRPEVEAIIDDGFRRIKNELNDEQKPKLDQLREKMERRRHAREGAFPKTPAP